MDEAHSGEMVTDLSHMDRALSTSLLSRVPLPVVHVASSGAHEVSSQGESTENAPDRRTVGVEGVEDGTHRVALQVCKKSTQSERRP